MAPSGKGAEETPGMGKDDLKKNLKLSKRRAIHVALAMSEGKPVLLMDKMKRGQGLDRDLKKQASDAKDHRWGVVHVEKDDPKRAVFVINKALGGLARKLIIALKGTGYNKVTIKLEDGSVAEDEAGEDDGIDMSGEDEDDDMDADGDEQQASDQSADSDGDTDNDSASQQNASADSDQDTSAQIQDDASASGDTDSQQTSGDQTDPSGQLDAATIAKQLTGLVNDAVKAIAADPTKKNALLGLANDARQSLKQNDLQGAAAAMDNLRAAMGQSTDTSSSANSNGSAQPDASASSNGSAQPDTSDGSADADGSSQQDASAQADQSGDDDDALDESHKARAPAIQKAQTAWNATLQKVEGDLGKLHNAFGSAFKGHDQEEEIGKAFRSRVDAVMEAFDQELHEVLESVNRARGRREREEMVKRAHAILARHRQRIQADQTIVQIDTNPFVSLSIGKTIGTTIDALTRAIR